VPGVIWFQGDLSVPSDNNPVLDDALIASGNVIFTGTHNVTLYAPNIDPNGAADTCSNSIWPTNLCSAYGGSLSNNPLGNTAIISVGTSTLSLFKITIYGNLFVDGALTGNGTSEVHGDAVVTGAGGATSTFNGGKFYGLSGAQGAIQTGGTTYAINRQWVGYK
jgi:hypothetical protein